MQFDESELISLCKSGNQQSFTLLYDKYANFAYGTALLLVRNPNIATDVCQDSFIKAFRNIKKFQDGNQFKPWFLQSP